MPRCTEPQPISANERRREVTAILARAVRRLRRSAGIGVSLHAPESRDLPENGLELPAETRLSVPHGTRGLRLRGDGDDV